jgi:GDP-mannose 4,6-dehydratase
MLVKKALITGITGMVGSHLADFLLENTDWQIHGMCRWRSPLDNVSHLLDLANKKERVYFHNADLNDYISLDNLVKEVKPDFVFHLAAQSYPQTSFTAPLDTLSTNINGTCSLLEAIKNNKLDPIIHICSSSEVFGRVKKENTPIKEDCNFHPASPYAISKIGTDLLSRYYAEAYGLRAISTRMFTHTGPRRGDVFAESSFAKQIAMIEAGDIDPVIKVGNLDSLRTFADVRDAVRAYYMLVTVNPQPGEYYNIGGSYSCTIGEMLNFLISLSSKKDEIKIEVDSSRLRPIDADLQVPDTSKFEKHSSWKAEISFEKTMTDLLEYWREKVNSKQKFLTR